MALQSANQTWPKLFIHLKPSVSPGVKQHDQQPIPYKNNHDRLEKSYVNGLFDDEKTTLIKICFLYFFLSHYCWSQNVIYSSNNKKQLESFAITNDQRQLLLWKERNTHKVRSLGHRSVALTRSSRKKTKKDVDEHLTRLEMFLIRHW